jgi:endoribonuclease Dicer
MSRGEIDAEALRSDGPQTEANHEEAPQDYEGDSEGKQEGIKRWLTIDQTPRPRKISAKKLADKISFRGHLESHPEILTKASSDETADGYHRTTAWLAKDHGAKTIIHNPRDYQMELLERAKQENVIAVLDTGKL